MTEQNVLCTLCCLVIVWISNTELVLGTLCLFERQLMISHFSILPITSLNELIIITDGITSELAQYRFISNMLALVRPSQVKVIFKGLPKDCGT